ncbi:hypothetical protein GCM10020367_28120 [Streptomyces sannanensis]|uniref:Secreted protein n=1 Tax=Streptomyces sannanensis TaxID=285536 RepID=A0ABP6SBD6_9ACTN
MMRGHLKLAAVLVAVVLALTGFSPAGHGSGGKGGGGKGGSKSSSKSSGGGGGCSSSKKKNDDYDSDDGDSYSGSSGSGGSTPTPTSTPTAADEVTVDIVGCVRQAKGKQKARPSALVKVTAPAGAERTYRVSLRFLGATGGEVDDGTAEVELDGGEVRTVTVRMDNPRKLSKVRKCEVEATEAVQPSPSSSS